MKLRAFRQLTACVIVVAMLFNVAAPLGLCLCEGCYCEKSILRFLPELTVADNKCCQTLPEPLSEMSCPCRCGDVQDDDKPALPAVLTAKMPNLLPDGGIVTIVPAGFSGVSKGLSFLDTQRASFPSHVPLHVLLCVFLN